MFSSWLIVLSVSPLFQLRLLQCFYFVAGFRSQVWTVFIPASLGLCALGHPSGIVLAKVIELFHSQTFEFFDELYDYFF